jgi:hypothetical protein
VIEIDQGVNDPPAIAASITDAEGRKPRKTHAQFKSLMCVSYIDLQIINLFSIILLYWIQ